MKNTVFRAVLVLTLISVLISLFSCRRIENGNGTPADTQTDADLKLNIDKLGKGEMLVEVLKLGKADCIVIHNKEYTVVIDAGEEDDKSAIFSRFILNKTDKIDYLIITHFDKDPI